MVILYNGKSTDTLDTLRSIRYYVHILCVFGEPAVILTGEFLNFPFMEFL